MEENKNNEVLIYQSQDGTIKVDVLFEGETVWLTIDQMSTLFGKSRSTINEHILNIYQEGELLEDSSMRKIGISDFSTKGFPNGSFISRSKIFMRQVSIMTRPQR